MTKRKKYLDESKDLVKEKFWELTDRSDLDSCWTWVNPRRSSSENFRVDGKNYAPFRVAYALEIGPIGVCDHVIFSCNSHECMNPYHMTIDERFKKVGDKTLEFRPDDTISVGEGNIGFDSGSSIIIQLVNMLRETVERESFSRKSRDEALVSLKESELRSDLLEKDLVSVSERFSALVKENCQLKEEIEVLRARVRVVEGKLEESKREHAKSALTLEEEKALRSVGLL